MVVGERLGKGAVDVGDVLCDLRAYETSDEHWARLVASRPRPRTKAIAAAAT